MEQTETQHLVQIWLDYLATQGRSKHTLSAYRRAIYHLAKWSQTTYGEPFALEQLIARDIRDWKSYHGHIPMLLPNKLSLC